MLQGNHIWYLNIDCYWCQHERQLYIAWLKVGHMTAGYCSNVSFFKGISYPQKWKKTIPSCKCLCHKQNVFLPICCYMRSAELLWKLSPKQQENYNLDYSRSDFVQNWLLRYSIWWTAIICNGGDDKCGLSCQTLYKDCLHCSGLVTGVFCSLGLQITAEM